MQTHRLEAAEFYDILGDIYYDLFDDFWPDVEIEGAFYDSLLRRRGAKRILDCTCGPGTQIIGLKRRGYDVVGTDASPRFLRMAAENLAKAGLSAPLSRVDVRALATAVSPPFDAVISGGNSLPHLGDLPSIRAAIVAMVEVTAKGGWILVNIRDYDQVSASKPCFDYRIERRREDGRIDLIYDYWDHRADGRIDLNYILLTLKDSELIRSERLATLIYPILPSELMKELSAAGCASLERVAHPWGSVFIAQRSVS